MTTERMNYQISNNETGLSKMNERDKQLRLATNLTPIYTHQIVNYINARIENDEVREMMISKVKSYPHNALDSFMRRFDTFVAECVSKLNKNRQQNEQSIKKQKQSAEPINSEDLLDLQDKIENNEEHS